MLLLLELFIIGVVFHHYGGALYSFELTRLFSVLHLQDMKDMRACYDGLLSAAAASANSAYGTTFFLCISIFYFVS